MDIQSFNGDNNTFYQYYMYYSFNNIYLEMNDIVSKQKSLINRLENQDNQIKILQQEMHMLKAKLMIREISDDSSQSS